VTIIEGVQERLERCAERSVDSEEGYAEQIGAGG
jgi:hypothetical protein